MPLSWLLVVSGKPWCSWFEDSLLQSLCLCLYLAFSVSSFLSLIRTHIIGLQPLLMQGDLIILLAKARYNSSLDSRSEGTDFTI